MASRGRRREGIRVARPTGQTHFLELHRGFVAAPHQGFFTLLFLLDDFREHALTLVEFRGGSATLGRAPPRAFFRLLAAERPQGDLDPLQLGKDALFDGQDVQQGGNISLRDELALAASQAVKLYQKLVLTMNQIGEDIGVHGRG